MESGGGDLRRTLVVKKDSEKRTVHLPVTDMEWKERREDRGLVSLVNITNKRRTNGV
jgi:hypothetical protein